MKPTVPGLFASIFMLTAAASAAPLVSSSEAGAAEAPIAEAPIAEAIAEAPIAAIAEEPIAEEHGPPSYSVVSAPAFEHPLSRAEATTMGVANVVVVVELDTGGNIIGAIVDNASHEDPRLRSHALQSALQTTFTVTGALKVPLTFAYEPSVVEPTAPTSKTPEKQRALPLDADVTRDIHASIESSSDGVDTAWAEDAPDAANVGQNLLLAGAVIGASALFVSLFSGATAVDNAVHLFDDDKSDVDDIAEASREHAFGNAHMIPVIGPLLALPYGKDTTTTLLAVGLGMAQLVGVGLVVVGAGTWGTAWILE